ncbi:hypothetical protein PHYSODRAFT_525809, partial [Phytophthora sojae]
YTVDLLTAMKWCESAWDNVSVSTIQKCWLHSTLISNLNLNLLLLRIILIPTIPLAVGVRQKVKEKNLGLS